MDNIIITKKCRQCKIDKQLREFRQYFHPTYHKIIIVAVCHSCVQENKQQNAIKRKQEDPQYKIRGNSKRSINQSKKSLINKSIMASPIPFPADIISRICRICHEERPIDNFHEFTDWERQKRMRRATCKPCVSRLAKEKRDNNPTEKQRVADLRHAKYRETKNDPEVILKAQQQQKQYKESGKKKTAHERNKESRNAQRNKRRNERKQQDPIYRLRENTSSLIVKMLKKNGGSKRGSSFLEYIGYTMDDLRKHLENLFEPWMTWNNWGLYRNWDNDDSATWTWQIDHKIPQCELPYSSMEDENFKKCWALSNLRPLSAKENNRLGLEIAQKKIAEKKNKPTNDGDK